MPPPSLSEAFTQAMRSAPPRWPRTSWQEREIDSATVEFVNGDFRMLLRCTDAGWQVAELTEANATQRRLWWLWFIPWFALGALGVVVIVRSNNGVWGLLAGVAAVMLAREFFKEAHRRRRRGSREPT